MSVAGVDSKVRSLASPSVSAAEYIARRRSHALYGARHAVVLRSTMSRGSRAAPITPSIADVHEGEAAGSQPPRWTSPSATKTTTARSAPAIPRGTRYRLQRIWHRGKMLRVCREQLSTDPATMTDERAPQFPRPCPGSASPVWRFTSLKHADDAGIGRNRVTSWQFQAYLRPSMSGTARSASRTAVNSVCTLVRKNLPAGHPVTEPGRSGADVRPRP